MRKSLAPGFGLGGRFDRAFQLDPSPLFAIGTDEYWMEQALLISMNSVGLSPPNPSVGCILVKDQKQLASGFTQATGQAHAERRAFQNLPPELDLKDVTAFVTLEPCSHFGSQPPCVELFLQRPVKRVVVAMQDPDHRVNGLGLQKLKDAGIDVTLGVLESEVSAFQFPFLANRVLQRPVWIAKWAQTPAGFLADAQGQSKWITGPKSRAYTHWLRQKYDAIVVGARTVIADQPSLTVRDSILPHRRHPVKIVFDPRGHLLHSQFSGQRGEVQAPPAWNVFVCESVLQKSDPALTEGFHLIPEGPAPLAVRFQKAVEGLNWKLPLQSVMVEGGPTLLREILACDGFDAAHIFTGKEIFENTHEQQRVGFDPKSAWNCISQQNFDEDRLQEWVKEF